MTANSVRPFTPDHSIHEVAFVINFANPIAENVLVNFKGLSDKFISDLPKIDEQRASGFIINPREKIVSQELDEKLVSLSFKSFNSKGKATWNLRGEASILAVNCLDYSRWDDVWSRVFQYLAIAIPVFVSPENPIVSLALQYIDKFIYEGNPDSYKISTIFDTKSGYLNKQVNDSGPFWHLHQGWFVNRSDVPTTRILNQLNITAALVDKEHFTTIDHNSVLQFKTHISSSKYLLEREISGKKAIDFYFNHLHAENKEILSKLLNEKRIKEIKLFD